jgi:hypothetical protein
MAPTKLPAAHRLPFHPANIHSASTSMLRRFFGFSILSAFALACSHDETASAHSRNGPRSPEDGVAPRPAVIEPASQPYKVAPVASAGTIAGTVDFEGTAPVAEVVRPSVDRKVCGNSIIAKNVALAGTRVSGAVVWLTDIRAGKPFPLSRRFDLTNDSCTLDPFIQVMPTNGTLNVGNDDRVLQTNRFINVGTGQVVAVAPFNDDGEVVPVDRFTVPAEIEVVSEQHPWTHAWMAVLDCGERDVHDRRRSTGSLSDSRVASESRIRGRQCHCCRGPAGKRRISDSESGARSSDAGDSATRECPRSRRDRAASSDSTDRLEHADIVEHSGEGTAAASAARVTPPCRASNAAAGSYPTSASPGLN